MQAIQVKYLPATEKKDTRLKAWAYRGSIEFVPRSELEPAENARLAVQALVDQFVAEDERKYGIHMNPWADAFIMGTLPNGDYVAVSAGCE